MIVEGGKLEPQIMNNLLKVYNLKDEYKLYSYGTNIYELYDRMFSEDDDIDALDFLQLLKSKEADKEKKKIFDLEYSDIILIFDFDPQDDRYSPEKIKKMKEYFNESTENGKLYINYPMVESFKHVRSFPEDNEYKNRKVTLEDVNQYKTIVGREAKITQINKYDKEKCNQIILHNIKKANYILNNEYNFSMNKEEYYDLDFDEILSIQNELLEKEKYFWVLNTCSLFIMDYDYKLVLEEFE